MIINKVVYMCPTCRKSYFFETSKEYSTVCPVCNVNMTFIDNVECDTERAERVKNAPKYDPTQDPDSPWYVPVVKCPYCSSKNVSKISMVGRAVSTGLFGISSKKIGKQWHCKQCGSDF